MMRRLLDLAFALLLLLPVLALALPVGAAVAVVMGSPALFRQTRSGLRGRPFVLLKFRTMHPETAGATDAERLGAFGRFLRRSRLDELPQLWNVLGGDMGIVGPRPLLPITIAQMGPRGDARGAIRPGLTGWAQLHGGPELSDDDKLALDLWYIHNRGPLLDLKIMAGTVGVILFGDRVNSLAVEEAHAGRSRRRG